MSNLNYFISIILSKRTDDKLRTYSESNAAAEINNNLSLSVTHIFSKEVIYPIKIHLNSERVTRTKIIWD